MPLTTTSTKSLNLNDMLSPMKAPSVSNQLPRTGSMNELEADQFIDSLLQSGWARLACQDADPLAMLFNDRARHWTVGWEPGQESLLLLVWEVDSWQNKPVWLLYRNGELLFETSGAQSPARADKLTQLLESATLPTITPDELVSRLSDFRLTEPQRRQAAEQILQTLGTYPDLRKQLKTALFALLEAELDQSNQPTLEVMKLHRLAHKNLPVTLFQACLQRGWLHEPADLAHLQAALQLLQQNYLTLGREIHPLFLPGFQQAYQEFRGLFTECMWRVHQQAASRKKPVASAGQKKQLLDQFIA